MVASDRNGSGEPMIERGDVERRKNWYKPEVQVLDVAEITEASFNFGGTDGGLYS